MARKAMFRQFLTNLDQPMPLPEKVRKLTGNLWRRVALRQTCCGHPGEPGCWMGSTPSGTDGHHHAHDEHHRHWYARKMSLPGASIMLVHEDAMFPNQACLRLLALRECGRLTGV